MLLLYFYYLMIIIFHIDFFVKLIQNREIVFY